MTGIKILAQNFRLFISPNLSSMNNVASRRFYDESHGAESPLAPVIPLKSVKEKNENNKANPGSLKTGLRKKVPDFTEPVFKPKKHDML